MGLGEDLFGKKPRVPPLARTSLDASQRAAVTANEAIQPEAAKMAGFTEAQILQMLGQVVPDLAKIQSQASSNISDELAGKIPKDILGRIQDSGAGRALAGGFGGSEMHGDLVARDLGLTSLELMDKGLSSAEKWLATSERMIAPAVAELNSMFVTPMEEYQTTDQQNQEQFQRQWMVNQIAAAPDPVMRGIQDSVMEFMQSVRGGSSIAPANGQQWSQMGGGGGSTYTSVPGFDNMFNNDPSLGGYGGSEIQIDTSGGAGTIDTSTFDASGFV